MKNSNDTNGNRTLNLPTCSAMPQSTALPRVPHRNQSTKQYEIGGTPQPLSEITMVSKVRTKGTYQHADIITRINFTLYVHFARYLWLKTRSFTRTVSTVF
jgi:hypothetical protein